MRKVSSEIISVAADNSIYIEKLQDKEAEMLRGRVIENYVCMRKGSFLWEKLKEAAVKVDNNGWEKISEFVGEKKCLMFFDDVEDGTFIILKNGETLYKILAEMYGFEFYLTDFDATYMICFNHHNCLLGCGIAKEWVESL